MATRKIVPGAELPVPLARPAARRARSSAPKQTPPRAPTQSRQKSLAALAAESLELQEDTLRRGSTADRRREASRIVVVMLGVALLLLVINRSAAGQVLATALDWTAYLVPPVLVAVGLDLLRRAGGGRAFLKFEEINGIAALFLAGLVFCGTQHHGGPLGNAIADGLASSFGIAGAPVATAFLAALGCVLAFHVTTRQLWRGSAHALRRSGTGARLGARGGARMLGFAGHLLRIADARAGPRRTSRLPRNHRGGNSGFRTGCSG